MEGKAITIDKDKTEEKTSILCDFNDLKIQSLKFQKNSLRTKDLQHSLHRNFEGN